MTEEANQGQPNGGEDQWGPDHLRKQLDAMGAAIGALPETIINATREAFPTKTTDTSEAASAQQTADASTASKADDIASTQATTQQAKQQYQKGWLDKFMFGGDA